MVHRVEKGGNYGWAAMEGPQPIKPNEGRADADPPGADRAAAHASPPASPAGYVYRGKKFPELRGAYVFGDWETRRLWAARFEGDRTKEMPEIDRAGRCASSPSARTRTASCTSSTTTAARSHTLERNDAAGQTNADFPTKLSRDRAVRLGEGPQAGAPAWSRSR